MIIKKAILHILDFNSDMCVMSQKELDISDFGTGEFINKHVERVSADSAAKKGRFNDISPFKQILARYLENKLSFTEFSTAVCNLLYEKVAKADELESMDLLVCQYGNESKDYVGVLVLPNKIAYTHQVVSEDDGISNKIIRYYTLLPNVNQKVNTYALINLENKEIRLCDKKRGINGEDVLVLPDYVLGCTYDKSPKETVNLIKKAAVTVAEEFGANPAVAVSRAKNFIRENAIEDVPFTPDDLGAELFPTNQMMKDSFREKARDLDIPAKIKVENQKVVKSIGSHKIKTDTGIEIKIPSEYMENSRYVEFINNPDGTLSIQLKNIAKIINR